MATIPKQDTAPLGFQAKTMTHFYNSRAISAYLDKVCETCPKSGCDCPFPAGWMEAAAMEAYVAFTETLDTWVETLIAGRPYDTPLVEYRELDERPQAAAEMRAER